MGDFLVGWLRAVMLAFESREWAQDWIYGSLYMPAETEHYRSNDEVSALAFKSVLFIRHSFASIWCPMSSPRTADPFRSMFTGKLSKTKVFHCLQPYALMALQGRTMMGVNNRIGELHAELELQGRCKAATSQYRTNFCSIVMCGHPNALSPAHSV